MNTFYHSGSLGDQIYSLLTVQALGGGVFVSGMHTSAYLAIRPLLWEQPFIAGTMHVSEATLSPGWIDLSVFRNHPLFTRRYIPDLHAEMQGIKIDASKRWLTLPPITSNAFHPFQRYLHIDHPYAVVSVTPRYRDRAFSWINGWRKEIRWLRERVDRIYFVSTEIEYRRFCVELGGYDCVNVHYFATENLLEAALVIDRARLFSGNQSGCLAIRQACGKPWRFEQSPNHRDTQQNGPNETILNPVTRRIHFAMTCIKKMVIDNQQTRL